MNRQILQGDALEKLKEIKKDKIGLITTDPPYGYSFMNKSWDKALVSVETWKECLRVLKPGGFAFVMSAPRQDVMSRMIVNLEDAGFVTNFTPIFWAYATGFPKATNISKMVDKKLGKKREKKTVIKNKTNTNSPYQDSDVAISKQAKKLNGSYAGFQPKPAVEVVLVCMKPLNKKNYIEQAMDNAKGITWLDDCRIPFVDDENIKDESKVNRKKALDVVGDFGFNIQGVKANPPHPKGRFPANLLVSDDSLNDGKITKSKAGIRNNHNHTNTYDWTYPYCPNYSPIEDEGSFSRYFDLDKWNAQFIITPKPSVSEKQKGLKQMNTHPTVKPISLMKYLITMGSRKNDLVLDPFLGSGTTGIACEMLGRNWIGIELLEEHIEIAKGRLRGFMEQERLESFT